MVVFSILVGIVGVGASCICLIYVISLPMGICHVNMSMGGAPNTQKCLNIIWPGIGNVGVEASIEE